MPTFRLPDAFPGELSEELLKKIAYLSEGLAQYSLTGQDRRIVDFQMRAGWEGEAPAVLTRIEEAALKLSSTYRAVASRTLFSRKGSGQSETDPHPELLRRGDLFHYGPGRYGFGPRLLELLQVFDLQTAAQAARMQAPAYQFPSLIGADVLDACKYLRSFPSSLNLVSHLRENLDDTRAFASQVKWDGSRLEYPASSLGGVKCLLAPSICFHHYAWLQGAKLAEPSLITAVGKCFRYESSNMTGLERLWDFTMRELIYVGPQEYVFTQRDAMVALTQNLLEDWGLRYEIRSATDPFFIEDYSKMAAFQMSFELKFEILAPLPYKNGKELAVGSINYHQDFFGRIFGIEVGNAVAHTGCLGFGLERVILAFLAQHGLDKSRWPDAIARCVQTW